MTICAPQEHFQLLFREDVTVAGLCRNFLVAQRYMIRYGAHPVSHPSLPDVSRHPLWQEFDAALEQVALYLEVPPGTPFVPPDFFNDQLCAAELALDGGRVAPTALPIVLQALLGAAHRARALDWLASYVAEDVTVAAGHLLAIDALPYIAGLLRTRRASLIRALLVIWTHLIYADRRAVIDLGDAEHGLSFLIESLESDSDAEATAAAYALTIATKFCSQSLPHARLRERASEVLADAAAPALRIW